jgi:hypothetical protein
MRNRNHSIFRPVGDEQDSCIAAAHRADERYRRRLRSEPEHKDQEPPEPSRYVAVDGDLPEFFWPPSGV